MQNRPLLNDVLTCRIKRFGDNSNSPLKIVPRVPSRAKSVQIRGIHVVNGAVRYPAASAGGRFARLARTQFISAEPIVLPAVDG